jgi:glycosyltransferase involved in cell wall biosynthesis
VITLNEEDRLGDCLASAPFAAEKIVVDSLSTDRTREVAAAGGARVVPQAFLGHVQQKNLAVSLATTEWVLCLDADERLSPELAGQIEEALGRDEVPDAFSMPRRNHYLGRWIDHGGWYPDRKVRLFRRDRARWGGVNPHDHVQVEGATECLTGDILHYPYRSVSDHLKQIDFFTTIAAREKYDRGKRGGFARMLLHPPWKFLRMYFLRAGFLDGRAGFAVAALGSWYVFLKYLKLWEMTRRGRGA